MTFPGLPELRLQMLGDLSNKKTKYPRQPCELRSDLSNLPEPLSIASIADADSVRPRSPQEASAFSAKRSSFSGKKGGEIACWGVTITLEGRDDQEIWTVKKIDQNDCVHVES